MITNDIYIYLLPISFIIFTLLNKIIALIILLNISITTVRYYMNIFGPIFIFLFLLFYKLNAYMKRILYLLLLVHINYWLFNEGFIYGIIDNNFDNKEIVNNINNYLGIASNIGVLYYSIYVLYFLFGKK
jgi:hypothetical protein